MYVRFVVLEKDEDSHQEQGLFQAAYNLYGEGRLSEDEAAWYQDLRRWFGEHLDKPDRFSRSSRAHAHPEAISWFRASAREHIDKMRDLAALLERHGLITRMLDTDRPGYIVFEDDIQIAAVPFREGTF